MLGMPIAWSGGIDHKRELQREDLDGLCSTYQPGWFEREVLILLLGIRDRLDTLIAGREQEMSDGTHSG